jgi:5-methylcytosine-specific restriction endonuclease McrA
MTEKKRSYREIFGQFKKSFVGKELKSHLYRLQRFTCPSCGELKQINELEIHHLKPVKLLEKEQDLINLTSIHNLVLLCSKCNKKQGSKLDLRFT